MIVTDKLSLLQRLEISRKCLEPVKSDYRVVFETDIDNTAQVLIPDPDWMACALHGGILPPLWAYSKLKHDDNGNILNGHILHMSQPIGPMTEEEAIEYLIQKDIPSHVWHNNLDNRRKFIICKKTQIPKNRKFRGAWKLKDVV